MVLCPRSNDRLGVGAPPVRLYRQAGVRLALGTDSLGSNDSLSLWDELAFAWPRFSGSFSAEEMLQVVTCNGADALGLKGELGRLQPGSGANFQVVELATATSVENLSQSLCEQAASLRVVGLVLGGNEYLPSCC